MRPKQDAHRIFFVVLEQAVEPQFHAVCCAAEKAGFLHAFQRQQGKADRHKPVEQDRAREVWQLAVGFGRSPIAGLVCDGSKTEVIDQRRGIAIIGLSAHDHVERDVDHQERDDGKRSHGETQPCKPASHVGSTSLTPTP